MPLTLKQKSFIEFVDNNINEKRPQIKTRDWYRKKADAYFSETAKQYASKIPLFGHLFEGSRWKFKHKLLMALEAIKELPTDNFNVYVCLLKIAISEVKLLLDESEKDHTFSTNRRIAIRLFINQGMQLAREFSDVEEVSKIICTSPDQQSQWTLDLQYVWSSLKVKEFKFTDRQSSLLTIPHEKSPLVIHSLNLNSKMTLEVIEQYHQKLTH